MPRRKIVFYPKVYYHIYNRSFDGDTIFIQRKDFERFYVRMYQISDDYQNYNFEIKAFCLMPNHFHLLVAFNSDEKINIISKFFGRIQNAYGKYYSMKYDKKGPVFQDRFKVKVITDEKYMRAIVNYIQRNSEKHFNIKYEERQRRSDIKIDGNYEEMIESLENYKLEF